MSVKTTLGVWRVTLDAKPEAELRWNTSGINPKDGAVYDGSSIEIDGSQRTTLYVYAVKGGVSAEKKFVFEAAGAQRQILDDQPARVRDDFPFGTQGEVQRVLRASKGNPDISFGGVSVTVGSGENTLRVRSGGEVRLTGHDMESMIEGLRIALGNEQAEVQLRFREVDFPDGYALRDFADQVGISIPVESVEQA